MSRSALICVLALLAQWGSMARAADTDPAAKPAGGTAAPPASDSTESLKQEIDKLRQQIAAIEERLKTEQNFGAR